MKGCYAIEDLEISKEEFEKPEQLSIETECDTTLSDEEEMPAQELIIPDIDF
jgi:penicillin-binding protein 1A